MPVNNIKRRKSIHDRETPQREESDQYEGIILERNSISKSESDEEYDEETILVSKTTQEELKITKSLSIRLERKQGQTGSVNNKPASDIALSWKILSLCLIFFAIVAYFQQPENQRSCSFENLRNEYPKEIDLVWKQLKVGIEMILNKKIEKPAVYLLAHTGKQSSSGLVEKIAQQSSACFGKNLIPMEKDDFMPDDDYGYAIEKYKSKIKEGNVFLIANLNEIPALAARAFHAICDTHSPIQKNVVIFMSLTIEENKKGNAHFVAEETLKELWGSELGLYELDPLITRVTDQVIILNT